MVKRRPSTHFVTAHSSAQYWPRRTSLPSVFTAFIGGLQGERTPDADLFHDAWHGLRAALANEMKKRGLWQSPPSYLGICGWESWDSEEPQGPGAHRTQGALGELVADCYVFIFVDRLQSLKRQLQDRSDIDGLVLLNIRHFLHERQKAHDPLGFRIFELLQSAVEEALSSGALHVLAGDKKIRNDTLLGFQPAAPLQPTPADWEQIVLQWNDELMPALVTARTRQQVVVVRRLRDLLLELPQRGVETFRFKDLLGPLKRDARERWAALLEEEETGAASPPSDAVQILAPAPPESNIDVSASIDQMETDPRTRSQLKTLWQHLWQQHGEEGENAGPGEPKPGRAGKHLPSLRQLGQHLNISRKRLPVLFVLLRQLMSQR